MKNSSNRSSKPELRHFQSNWDEQSIFDKDTLCQVILSLCSEVDSDLSRRVTNCIKENDFDRLMTISVSPDSYESDTLYIKDAQIVGLIKKYPHWDIRTDPKLEAMKKFISAEEDCMRTNTRIREGFLHENQVVHTILGMAQYKISNILGDAPNVTDLAFSYGPGSNYSVKNNTSALDKLRSTLDVTPNCKELAIEFLASCPGLLSMHLTMPDSLTYKDINKCLNVIPGDQLSFVPKTALTDRPIGVNGTINSVIQRSLGKCMKGKLFPYIDLGHAQSKHRDLAKISSKDGKFCTVDLASASDTISHGIVHNLFPSSWTHLMDQCRSEAYTIDDVVYDYHKYSAMGNGYTFEMETILFYAICVSIAEYYGFDSSSVSVYGDDIIAPNDCYDLISEVLTHCGFTLNDEKSFNKGSFRESCGGDYFDGYDVRPFYLKDHLTYRTVFLFHNFLVRKGLNFVFPKTFRLIRALIPKNIREAFRGADKEGDGYLVDLSLIDSVGHYLVRYTPKMRKLPKYLSYNTLKTFALYRQLKPEYDLNLRLYMGVGPIKGLPSYEKKRDFTHEVFRYTHI